MSLKLKRRQRGLKPKSKKWGLKPKSKANAKMYFVPAENLRGGRGGEGCVASKIKIGETKILLPSRKKILPPLAQKYWHFSNKEFHGAEMKLPTNMLRKKTREKDYYHN